MKKIFESFRWSTTGFLFQATGFTSLSGVGSGNNGGSGSLSNLFSNSTSLATFFNNLFLFAISLGAIIAVVQLVIAGYYYMFSDMWTRKEQAKTKFKNVITGLLLLLSIWLILYKINPDLTNLDVLGTIKNKTSPSQDLIAPTLKKPATGPCPPGSGAVYRIPDTGDCV